MKGVADVVVVGAGPVGLLTAIELTLGGIRVLVLERLSSPNLASKALGIGPLGGEALQRRGLSLSLAVVEARTMAAIKGFMGQSGSDGPGHGSKIGGHFGGLKLIRREAQSQPERQARLVDQAAVEEMLAGRAHALGIEVRRSCEVTGFTQGANSVEVEWTAPSGTERTLCAYLVACDGGRSPVRKLAGFGFPGTDPTLTMYTAVVEIDHPERLTPLTWQRTASGTFTYGPFPGRVFMLDFSGPPKDREAPVTREEIERVLRRISGADIRVRALESGSRWTDNTRLADSYRRGRVFLAGDAAHVHSPFGGQGMSLGLVDAANLGWKLAAVLRGERPASLLDTYTAERRPVAEAVLANTLAQTAIMRPDPQSGAIRDVVAKLMQFDDANRLIGEMMSGLATRYDLGSQRDEVGRLLGDRPVRNGGANTSLYDLMQDGGSVFLDASDGKKVTALVATLAPRVRCATVEQGPSLLVRPDACVAWAGDADGTEGLADALGFW